jgi:glycine hydroxymethyltransferase
MIFFNKARVPDIENKINFSVFPSLQGGPHNNTIAGVATQLKVVMSPRFQHYAQQVQKNCRALAATIMSKGYVLATGGSDNHLLLWDLRPVGLSGNKFELMGDECNITVNKNAINGDKSAFTPGGVRVGTPALTSRGLNEADFEVVGGFLCRCADLCLDVQKRSGSKLLNDFKKTMTNDPEVRRYLLILTFLDTRHRPFCSSTCCSRLALSDCVPPACLSCPPVLAFCCLVIH